MNATPDLINALRSMSVLNSWAKSKNPAPRRAIYWLKSHFAVRDAVFAGLVKGMRCIQVTVTCNKCVNGIYLDWDGHDRGRCYHCKGSTIMTLKFVETTIQFQGHELVWHHPMTYPNGWLGWNVDDITPIRCEDWTAGKEGTELSSIEAAGHLNVVETYWPQWRIQSPYETDREWNGAGRYYLFNYSLLVEASKDACHYCNSVSDLHNFGLTLPPGLNFTVSICERCGLAMPDWSVRKRQFKMPQLHHSLQMWADRHTIDYEATWKRSYPC